VQIREPASAGCRPGKPDFICAPACDADNVMELEVKYPVSGGVSWTRRNEVALTRGPVVDPDVVPEVHCPRFRPFEDTHGRSDDGVPRPEDSVSGVLGEVRESRYGPDVRVSVPVRQGTDNVKSGDGDADDDEAYSCIGGTDVEFVVADSKVTVVEWAVQFEVRADNVEIDPCVYPSCVHVAGVEGYHTELVD